MTKSGILHGLDTEGSLHGDEVAALMVVHWGCVIAQ